MRTTPRQVGGGREREELVELARKSIRQGSKSFALASRLFDKPTREKAWLLYAWCRRCDDIADGQDHGGTLNLDEATAQRRIEAIRVLTRRALEGQPTAEEAFDALGQVALEAGLTEEMTDDVIDGFALDADGWRPRSEADLMRYAFHVAGAVGVMMARVMGIPTDDHAMLDRAFDLGLAFQLTNIARDLCEDDAAGRCYLPQEWLAEGDIPPGEHMRPEFREQLVALVSRLLDLADEHEAAARWGANGLRLRQRWAVLAAANIHGAIRNEVRALGPHAWDHRVRVGFLSKLTLTWQALREAFGSAPQPDPMPRWTRGELMTIARMAGPIAPMPQTPLPDEVV
uniref:phytoene/squalene synthase family protein n=1 Tax=Altererythrobacter segetis TaxID=1104773 RepID=UPI001A9C4919|nr:phytoene/squalene synthase family protein [Altererythrobacter segetis]